MVCPLICVAAIPVDAVTDTAQLRQFAARLARLGIRFAYDDFGAGQARLLELADVPPHFVKFDMSLIRSLHKASERKRQVVRDLVKMVLAAGSVPLAEGVEDAGQARFLRSLHCDVMQGYLLSKPLSVDDMTGFLRGYGPMRLPWYKPRSARRLPSPPSP